MLQTLIKQYINTNPQFECIKKIVKSNKIDHVAFRFKSASSVKIKEITEGYQLQPQVYTFNQFNAKARWYRSNYEKEIPRLFISHYDGDFRPIIKTPDMYKNINSTNSYLAWTTLFEGHINHIALEVDNIYQVTEEVIKNGIKMNEEGELYKISDDNCLIQTATMAIPVKYKFTNGETLEIPYTFVELIQRINGREGFEQENARRIFSSTKMN
jgi:hypothetical protein